MIDPDLLIGELKALRKGRATRLPSFVRRLGPNTKAIAGIADTDTAADARRKLRETIRRLLTDHADELLLPALAQFALEPAPPIATLAERQHWLSSQERYQPRTARRRMDEALEALVARIPDQVVAPASDRATSDWWVCSLEGVLHVTGDGPTLVERRTVEFVADGLDEITCALSVPRPDRGRSASRRVVADTLFGARIVQSRQPSEDHHEFRLRLPRRFRARQRHEFAMTFRLPAGQPIANHYVMQPLTPCERFRLVMRFEVDRRPDAIWVLDGVAPRVVDGGQPAGPLIGLDRLGELQREFHQLRQGLAYGVKWRS